MRYVCVLSLRNLRECCSVDLGIHPSRGNSQLKIGQFTYQNGCGVPGVTNYIGRKSKSGFLFFWMVELSFIPSFGPTPGVWSHSIIFGGWWLRAVPYGLGA